MNTAMTFDWDTFQQEMTEFDAEHNAADEEEDEGCDDCMTYPCSCDCEPELQ